MPNQDTRYQEISWEQAFAQNLHHGGVEERVDRDGVLRAYHAGSLTYWDVPAPETPAADVIGAIRLALVVAYRDPRATLRVIELLAAEAPPTPTTNTGAVDLLLRLVRADKLKLEMDVSGV